MVKNKHLRARAKADTAGEREAAIGNVESFIQEVVLEFQPDLAEQRRRGPGRPRVIPAMALWVGLLMCVLRGFSSQLGLWRLLSQEQLWFYPRFNVSDQAVYNRLARAAPTAMQQLFEQVTALLRERLAPFALGNLAPFASEVVALERTHLDPMARLLPALRGLPAGDVRLLPGKLAGVFDIRRQQWWPVEHIPEPTENDKVSARAMLTDLPRGALVLIDLGYFAFAWFDWLTDNDYWWVSRLRAKTSFKPRHVFYQHGSTFDGIVWLGSHRADRAGHAVRLVMFPVGTTYYRYLTNVRDPKLLPLADIARLYARRWDFELAVKLVKRELGLHLLWSAKTNVILLQVWAVLIIAQVLNGLRMEIAGRAKVDPFEVSLALLVEYLPRWAYSGKDPVALVVERGRQAGFIRPSTRSQIRAPDIPTEELVPLPADLVRMRTPRYAQRNCHRHRSGGTNLLE